MKLSEIENNESVYPRPRSDSGNVQTLVEKLKVGIVLDPIIVQNVYGREDKNTRCIVLNGAHRLVAYEEYNKLDGVQKITDIEVKYWKDTSPILFEENMDEMLVFAYQSNDEQGLNMRSIDTRHTARMLRERHPDWSVEYIGNKLNRAKSTIYEYVQDIIQRQQVTEHVLIMRLSRLGWTQQEIAEHPDITLIQSAISKIMKKFDTEQIHNHFYVSHKEVDKIAEMFDIDEQTAWAILLENKDDIERFKIFGKKEYGNEQPRLSDYWTFFASTKDPRIGIDYEGHLFGQEVMNIIYRYSKQGDLVVDPMVGGGATIDACLVMGRKCRAYDINPEISGRRDVVQHDAREELPQKAQDCSLILLDPPYYKKKEREYECEEFTENRDKFIENMKKVASVCFNALKQDGYLAFIYGQYIDHENEENSILNFHLCRLFEEIGFKSILKIQSPLSFNTQWRGDTINNAKNYQPWRILPVSRDWNIFKKKN